MRQILEDSGQAHTIDEIASAIVESAPETLKGKTPSKSLYSIVYRREKRRLERGQTQMFLTEKRGGAIYYRNNPAWS